MAHSLIRPTAYTTFDNEAAQIDKCKEWGLLSGKAARTKTFYYKGNNRNLACSIVGFVDSMTAVIEFDDQQLHCIHPSYLKEMQASNFSQRLSAAAAEGSADSETAAIEAPQDEAPAAGELIRHEEQAAEPQAEVTAAAEPGAAQPATAEPATAEPAKGKGKQAKTKKLELPEDKVMMTAKVQEFTTVPNNFSDNDDEVVIYEEVSITDPGIEVGAAWSSHSATLKKLELEIGDTIAFEAKIIAKKLTKHPVAYKINNPAKIKKV